MFASLHLSFIRWCRLLESILWSVLVIGVFAILNRIWLALFLAAENSRLQEQDDFANAAAYVYTDPRAARSI